MLGCHVIRHFFRPPYISRAGLRPRIPPSCDHQPSQSFFLSLFTINTASSRWDPPAMESSESTDTILEKLDATVPKALREFDAFPKLPSTYKKRSEGRGLVTALISLICFILVLNDLGEWVWGWSDYEFSVDKDMHNQLGVNVDIVVNMPCQCESIKMCV